VTIFSTTWVWAHLQVGTSNGTFGNFILVMNSKCIATCQLIGIRMVSGDICVIAIGGFIFWTIHCNFLHILFHVVLWIIMNFKTFRRYKLHIWVVIKLWLFNTFIYMLGDLGFQQKPFAMQDVGNRSYIKHTSLLSSSYQCTTTNNFFLDV
jgi:hypothetical protein